MGKRGRKSADELAVVASMVDRRPAPPDELTEEQSKIWKATAHRLPAEWFPPESWQVLAAYCRHVVTANLLSDQINQPDWLGDSNGWSKVESLDRLTRMRSREVSGLLSCARALRLTNQSRQDSKVAGRAAKNAPLEGKRPWEGWD